MRAGSLTITSRLSSSYAADIQNMDLSPLIAWGVPASGLAAAIKHGLLAADNDNEAHFGASLVIALALGIALTFLQVFLHGLCIEKAHLCDYRGDGNMAYWFQSFFAIPLFWFAGWAAWRIKQ
jgi:hypothetical protein